MKKTAIGLIITMLLSMLVACGNNIDEVNEVSVDLNTDNNIAINNTEGTGAESTNAESTDTETEVTETEDTETEGTETEGTETEGTETEGTETEGTETEGTETEGTETEGTETEGTETEGTEEVTEPVDYTAKISKPYDDVDYTPFEKITDFPNNPKINVKGVYVTANTAASERMDDIIELINKTELNAVVIDVKNDAGYITFHSEAAEKYVPNANKYVLIKDMEAFMAKMKENDIYTIARIVTFKSPQYAQLYPERAISYKSSGNVYYADKAYWASPFDEELWKYNVEVAKEAIEYGFNEIQFDYVRFPATGSSLDKNLDFRNPDNHSKTYAIQNFVKYAYSEINPMEAYVALDVFGWTATTINDSGIGQHWEGMTNVSDYMCPMVYPSHYGPNIFGLPVPDAAPYKTIYESMSDSMERNSNVETPADLRPWLQAFTAKWVKGYIPYGTAEIQAQIQACKDLGIEDYIFWNSGNNYNEKWFTQE
ncbi:MAG: putative glycoside hydrolase [Clostridiales bacterium]|nr:putative glycoside hydrolase [Clostridiales bacterium]